MLTFFRYIFRKTVPTFNPFQTPLKTNAVVRTFSYAAGHRATELIKPCKDTNHLASISKDSDAFEFKTFVGQYYSRGGPITSPVSKKKVQLAIKPVFILNRTRRKSDSLDPFVSHLAKALGTLWLKLIYLLFLYNNVYKKRINRIILLMLQEHWKHVLESNQG